jgi:hypothetical protein
MVERLKEFLGFLIALTRDGLQWEKDPKIFSISVREYKLVVDKEKVIRIIKYNDTGEVSLTLFPDNVNAFEIRQGRKTYSGSLDELLDDLFAEIEYNELGAERKRWIQNNIDRLILQLGG